MSSSPFDGMRPPGAPPELRRAVAEICGRAAVERPAPGLLERLGSSRRARWAWWTAVGALLAGHLVVASPPPASEAPAGGGIAPAFADEVPAASLWRLRPESGSTEAGSRWGRSLEETGRAG